MVPKVIGNKVLLDKELNALDDFVISFAELLSSLKINYVIVSGYVAILFGRSRGTEDIDILIDSITLEQFSETYTALAAKNYWILNATSEGEAFGLLKEKLSIRVAENKKVIPNFEVKFVKDELDRYSMDKKLHVELGGQKTLFISPFEMQIAYKLYLGGEKDIEDSYFLFSLFREKLDIKELKSIINSLKVEKVAKKYLKGLYG